MPRSPSPRPHRRNRGTGSFLWRLLAPAAFVCAGVLFVTSMVSAQGTDLRAGRYDDLQGLANGEAHDLEGLQARSRDLNTQVDRLTKDLGSTAVVAQQRRAAALEGPAGLRAVHGPGVTITLDDAPDDVLAEAGDDVSELLVHQQDIQAVANALWAGGAEAMTIQGQRVVATTGIKCVGNTVILHGVPYSPPYQLSAIGSTHDMLAAVAASPYIALYLKLVDQGLGWKVKQDRTLDLPGYEGSTELDYATPMTDNLQR
jgi:uncharacterized protein YlxW (UPF0749 family)